MSATWTLEEAVALCQLLEDVAPLCGCHIALTGGCLYKQGPRKDVDIVVYRIRQADKIDGPKFMQWLVDLGFKLKQGAADCWLMTAEYRGKPVDFFFPENEGGDYGVEWDDRDPDVDSDQPRQPMPAFFASMEDLDDVDF